MRMKTNALGRLFLIVTLTFVSGALWAETQYVQVREAVVRDKPSNTGKPIGKLPYTAEVTILKKQGAWVQVSAKELKSSGWLAVSSLSVKKISKNVGESGADASGNEVALAGKGFNDQVEKQYKTENSQLSFEWIDKMEKMSATEDEIADFLAIGPRGGDR